MSAIELVRRSYDAFARDDMDGVLADIPHGAPLPVLHAAGAGDLRRHRRHGADGGDRHRRDARALSGLNERLIAGVDELGGIVVTPREAERRGALVCIRSTDAPALVEALAAERIVTSERDGSLRVSPHAYNSSDDIDAVLAGLARHRELLASD